MLVYELRPKVAFAYLSGGRTRGEPAQHCLGKVQRRPGSMGDSGGRGSWHGRRAVAMFARAKGQPNGERFR